MNYVPTENDHYESTIVNYVYNYQPGESCVLNELTVEDQDNIRDYVESYPALPEFSIVLAPACTSLPF